MIKLDISYNLMTNLGAKIICKALKSNNSLVELNLYGTNKSEQLKIIIIRLSIEVKLIIIH